ncbi:MAG TPA: hypothetical protein VMV16_03215 [Solirubrobacteraceae bacterium]|nr:hypothetical protein [Solirubrobacteraceae bacterium]
MRYDPESEGPVTDVLAAEEFGVPAPDPALTPEELDLPGDLVGDQPRDVLAAEEFAMPAPDEARVPPDAGRRPPFARLVAINLPPLLGAAWLYRHLRRHQTPAAETEAEE